MVLRGFLNMGSRKYDQDWGWSWISDMSAERIKRFSAFGNCQSPNSRVAALTSMSLAPPKPKRQSSVDCGRPKGRNQSETKDQQNAQLVVSALDLAVEERRLAEFRTRCLVQEDSIIIIPSHFINWNHTGLLSWSWVAAHAAGAEKQACFLFGQICRAIWTNTLCNSNNYIL